MGRERLVDLEKIKKNIKKYITDIWIQCYCQ